MVTCSARLWHVQSACSAGLSYGNAAEPLRRLVRRGQARTCSGAGVQCGYNQPG